MIQSGSAIEMNEIRSESDSFQLVKANFNCPIALKSITCIHLFQDTIYLGTRTSKLYIFKIKGDDFVDQKVLIPHCEVVSSIIANEHIFITVAESDDEMPLSIWDVQSKMFLTALKSHESQVSKALFLSEPGWLATSSWDCTVKIWDLRNILEWESNIKTIKSEYPVLTVEQVSRDVIAFGGDDCYINFWNWKKTEFLGKFFGHAGSVTLIYVNLPFILTAGGDHKLKEWEFNSEDLKSGKIISETSEAIDDSLGAIGNKNTIAKMSREIKKNYDSSIFLVKTSEKQIFLLDRHGSRFLHTFGEEFIPCTNDFQYNENITGMANNNGKLYVSTTKGELKCFEISMAQSSKGSSQQ